MLMTKIVDGWGLVVGRGRRRSLIVVSVTIIGVRYCGLYGVPTSVWGLYLLMRLSEGRKRCMHVGFTMIVQTWQIVGWLACNFETLRQVDHCRINSVVWQIVYRFQLLLQFEGPTHQVFLLQIHLDLDVVVNLRLQLGLLCMQQNLDILVRFVGFALPVWLAQLVLLRHLLLSHLWLHCRRQDPRSRLLVHHHGHAFLVQILFICHVICSFDGRLGVVRGRVSKSDGWFRLKLLLMRGVLEVVLGF